MAVERVIFHVDMDAFFAAIEQLDNPSLRGRPVLVGHDGPRGVVAAASYEARRFGCHSAQPMAQASRACPDAVIVPVRPERYRQVSNAIFEVFERFTPVIEPLSIDEAFLDVTGSQRLLGEPATMAANLKAAIRETTQLTASIGVAWNKFLAKFASDLDKPDGLTLFQPNDVERRLHPLPIDRLWGVGPAMAARLIAAGIRTIGELATRDDRDLEARFGSAGPHLRRLSRGLDDRPVVPDHEARSIGQEQTFSVDVRDVAMLRAVLLSQVEQVARRLRKHQLLTRSVTLKVRYGEFQTITRSTTLATATNTTAPLWEAGSALLDRWIGEGFRAVRLIGVTASQLVSPVDMQPTLFEAPDVARHARVDGVMDRIVERFGKRAIHRGPGPSNAGSQDHPQQPGGDK